MKIVVLDAKTLGDDISLEAIEKLGECEIYSNIEDGKIAGALCDAEVCVTNKKTLGMENLKDCGNLKLICLFATGFNNVDVSYCRERGIKVRNVRSYCTKSVCQHTFALLFALMESIEYYDNFVKSGEYTKSALANHLGKPFCELDGKVWGIIGMGTIGRAVACAAEAFGAEVVYSPVSGGERREKYKSVSFDELLRESDVISIHSPLNEKTAGLIGAAEMAKMKKTALLVNVGRGGIINSAALAEAVDNGVIRGAALDVYEKEPPDGSDPLMRVMHKERFVFSPHIAWGSVEARQRCVKETAENIAAYMRGEEKNDIWT